MVKWLPILLSISLSVLAVSDVRSRSVSSWWLLASGILNFVFLWILDGWKCVAVRIVGNLLLLQIIGVALWIYARARHERMSDLFGAGDVIFLMVLSPAFGWTEYMRFIVASSIAGIILWPLFRKLQPRKTGVPMVSVMAVVYFIFMGSKLLVA